MALKDFTKLHPEDSNRSRDQASRTKADEIHKAAKAEKDRIHKSARLAEIIKGNKIAFGLMNLGDLNDIMRGLRSGNPGNLFNDVMGGISNAGKDSIESLPGKDKRFLRDEIKAAKADQQKTHKVPKDPEALLRSAYHSGRLLRAARDVVIAPVALTANLAEYLIPKKISMAIIGGAMAFNSVAVYAAINPSEQMPHQSNFQTAFHEACTTELMNGGSLLDAIYARNFSDTGNPDTDFAYNAMTAGRLHGVPPIALHLVSYFESAGHTDYQADNGSATGASQIVSASRFPYMKAYGTQTYTYMNAKDRVANNSGTDAEIAQARLIVTAIEYARDTKLSTLNNMINGKDLNGPALYAYNMVVEPFFQQELIALDMKKFIPGITDSNMTPEKLLTMLPPYYLEHHNLGASNYNALSQLAGFSDVAIADASTVISNYMSNKLMEVAKSNPGLLNSSMDGATAMQQIQANFSRGIKGPSQIMVNAYNTASSLQDVCVVKSEQPYPRPLSERPAEPQTITASVKVAPQPVSLSLRPHTPS